MLLILWNSLVFANVHIEITQGIDTAQPIAIVPFEWSSSQEPLCNKTNALIFDQKNIIDIAAIITADLNNSGKFNILSTSDLLYNKPTKVSDIIPIFWEKLGINTIVIGSVHVNNDNKYIISYQLVDTSNNPALIISENKFLVEQKWLRYIAHSISNEIFEKLTGIKGIFCTHIAYIIVTNTDNDAQYPYKLCIADYDGWNQIPICRSSAPLMSPAWSADGKKIAYVTFVSGHAELVIQILNSGEIYKKINFTGHNGAPAFSPDGKKIAFSLSKTGSLNLYIMNLESGDIQQLTKNRYNNTEPSWFPDSTNLAYTSDQGGTPQIYKINTYTTNIQRLSWLHTTNQNPKVSSDGNFIIMVSKNSSENKQNITKLDLLSGQEQTLTNSFLDDTPSIAPNDTMLIYSTIKELTSTSELALISIDGKFKAYLKSSENSNIKFPTWSSNLFQ